MRETGGFELVSTITLVLQANRLTKLVMLNHASQICKAYNYLLWNTLLVLYVVEFFIELCEIIQQKCQRPEATTYFQRITNKTFYRPAKIILCI